MNNDDLCKKAEEAIQAVHDDTSVSVNDALMNLLGLRDHCEIRFF